jgi:death-on-curing protein
MQFGGEELYSSLAEKAAALGFALIQNHPFVDGNKRVGHASMEVVLRLNGWEITASVDEQERLILDVAAGAVGRDELTEWLSVHVGRLQSPK